MADPTYDTEAIKHNPVWELAFSLSEILNDNAPIGWGRYIVAAECLLARYEMTLKDQPQRPVRGARGAGDA